MAGVDLADAYCRVPVLCIDQKNLLFRFEDNLRKYICLLSGLTSASRIFTETLKSGFSAFKKKGHQIMGYLHDTLLLGDTFT